MARSCLLLAAVVVVLGRRPQNVRAPEMVLQMETLPGASLLSESISPDGTKIVFQAIADGKSQLYLRSLDSDKADPLQGTETPGADEAEPCWKPDSRSIAFFSAGQLKRIDLDDGLVLTVAERAKEEGCAWSNDGTILFAT